MEKTQHKRLTELRKTIKESIHQKNLKELKKLVHQYFLILKPEAMKGRK
ncbi:MAG: hypothetical protein HQL12_00490 [Candidatus Omnitrophica bacterium]|nr:hypothetical protein [Candidatus Omnitrophota bacterium]